MIPSTAYVRFGPDGPAGVDASLRLTGECRIECFTYRARPPILSVRDVCVSVSVTVPDPEKVTAQDVEDARRLANAADRYVTELAALARASKDKAADAA